jgi:hypothetical protein
LPTTAMVVLSRGITLPHPGHDRVDSRRVVYGGVEQWLLAPGRRVTRVTAQSVRARMDARVNGSAATGATDVVAVERLDEGHPADELGSA